MDSRVPLQPLKRDNDGTPVFRANAIVVALLEYAAHHGQGLARIIGSSPGEDGVDSVFGKADWQQFAQLIGYSLEGYLELCYVDAEARERARAHALQYGFAQASAPAPADAAPVDGAWATAG